MFFAVCSRDINNKTITADEAYSKVFGQEDWGFFQARDGWICPECDQPVFLKGPHERVGKTFSFVVQAHFCHHSAAAAASCALFKAGGTRGQNQAEAIYADRKQSLRRFFAGVPETADFVAALLGGEEDAIREAARDIGLKHKEYRQHAASTDLSRGHADLTAELILERLGRVDSFLAGVFVLGADHKRKVRAGFLAEKGRKNRLRSLFIEFGRNRKKYFKLLAESNLLEEHDNAISHLASQLATEIEIAKQEEGMTHHGMALRILDEVMIKLGLTEPGEWPGNYLQYLHALPVLGSRLKDFEPLNMAHFQGVRLMARVAQEKTKVAIPSRLPPIRITTSRKLLVEARVIDQLVAEGSKLNGRTSFIRPGPGAEQNYYLAIPGNQCILLTSSLHTNLVKGSRPHHLEAQEILGDPELPEMLWENRIMLPPECVISDGVIINKQVLQSLRQAIEKLFGSCDRWRKGGLRYRRVKLGLRISASQ